MQTSETAPDVRFVRLPEVISIVGVSKSEIYRRIGRNEFPKGHRRSHRVTVWLSSDLQTYLRGQMATMDIEEEDLIG